MFGAMCLVLAAVVAEAGAVVVVPSAQRVVLVRVASEVVAGCSFCCSAAALHHLGC